MSKSNPNTYAEILRLEKKAANEGDLAVAAAKLGNKQLESFHLEKAHKAWRDARRLRNKIV